MKSGKPSWKEIIAFAVGDGAKMAWATITYILMAVVIYTA